MDFINQHQTHICDQLSTKGWVIIDNFLPKELIEQLARECRERDSAGNLEQAAVGRANARAVQQSIRGDKIQWLEHGMSAAIDSYLNSMSALRHMLNEQLFLGLESNENHFALYPPGAFYQRHLDRFRDNDSRTISSVLYLNEHWQADFGGELRLFDQDQAIDISPIANRLALFVSADIWHEVLPTKVQRLSLTGWFKRRT
ncbi:2OG-Fe(II) oxygenase [Sapientia aquatica]|uniref:2OG-Fe(II) oxygenase n=1 Tax=Sapientia aquatica TaxID=1549640 RepID=A0A4R5W7K6_9BURK|nr:2OG-Fe(II) oxygenase [Sapientia aquatica]TDK68444.1 2OG-Fe(II) oxygenase [Sapientia aquatica]